MWCAIDFDGNGVVSDVHTHGLELAQAIEPDPNKTRTLGNELTCGPAVPGQYRPLQYHPGSDVRAEPGGGSGGY